MYLLQDEVPSAVQGDPTRLRQILTNLIGNAIKFTDQGDVVVRVTTIEQDEETVWLRFEVCDTGIGIAPEDQSRLFTAFSQVDSSTTRKYGGTGLGLSITKELVHMMAGDIGVESTRSAGSTFWFTAHLATCSPNAPTTLGARRALSGLRVLIVDANDTNSSCPGLVTDPALEHRHILLAEDNPVNQEVACEILTSLGCCVQVVTNGRAALEALEHTTYDLALMDCQMPEMDGFEATRAIREREVAMGQAPLPIIAMTAHAMSDDREHCLTAGMSDYLSKPFTQEQLHAVLRRWLPLHPRPQASEEPLGSAVALNV